MDNQEIINISNQLAQAVEAALNPEVPPDKRQQAYNACEEFKEKSPLCIQCSVYLSLHGSHLVRHFGLQLMEYCVKYKWYGIDQSQKISIKDVTMSLLQSCEGDFIHHIHLRDALSRVIVEMIKREWPQHWPDLLPELFAIAAKGHIQAETVLLIFLRFIEDIVVLQTLEYAQRRKDLYQHLVLELENVFTFLLNLMAQHYKLNVPESVRVINLSLKLVSEIVEFAFINRIAAEETRLLPVLCGFLADENFQLETAECLNRIATKKGKAEDKKIICKLLFSSTLVNDISRINLLLQNGTLNERNYLFVKKISELLCSLCNLLCSVIKNDNDSLYEFIKLENMILLLEILTTLCNHPSLVVAFNVNCGWTVIFKHGIINKDANVLNYVTKWVTNVTSKIIRIPYNPENAVPMFQESYKYLVFDFDSEESFATFYYRFRVELLEAFRHLTAIAPMVTFSCIEQWLMTRIHETSFNLNAYQSIYSIAYLEWEGIAALLDTIVGHLPKNHAIPLERSLQLLDLCLNLKPSDPGVLSFVLSCISVFIYFVDASPAEVQSSYMPRVLHKVFSTLTFEIPGQTKLTRSKNVRNLRRHAACMLVKLGQKYPMLFLPFFDNIKKAFNDLKQDTNQLYKMEIVLFLEAMLSINNAFCEYERQSQFISEVFAEVKNFWAKLSSEVFNDYSKFASFIGLDSKSSSEEDIFMKNRGELMYCVDIIVAVIKRSSWPESKEKAINGGFVVGYEGDQPIYKNPATPHLLEALPGVFSLIKAFHSLWSPEGKFKLHSDYAKVHELTESELKSLFGGHLSQKPEFNSLDPVPAVNAFAKMQNFLLALYESCYTVITKACQNLGYFFYELPNFAPSFAASVFCNIDSIPDYRLRVMVKQFMKPFIYCCPASKYDDILMPIFAYFTSYMFERLSNKWKYLKECRESGKLKDDDEEDSKEVVEDLINTLLSREYMDVIKAMLLKFTLSDLKSCNGTANSNDELPSPLGSQSNLSYSTNIYESLSDLGIKFLRYESTRYGIISFILSSISWLDSTHSLKATFKVPAIMKQLSADGNVTQELAVQTLISLLQGLQLHGQHDSNQGSLLNCAIQVYLLVRPQYPQVLEIMTMVPGINMEDLQKFDQKVLKIGPQSKIDKGMREMFKKLVSNLIGKNIGQLFKRKETIRDLPRIEINRPKGENILNLSGNENDIGIANFFK
ncbi:exportin-5 [Planococcus citri]|uniref:exportin-5 n=1 Tax=Planococcus citri TaxID=170843 RepID=UPI0031F8641A